MNKLIVSAVLLFILSACGTYSTSSVTPTEGTSATNAVHKNPDQILVTEKDILDRPYKSLGDISVTVRKISLFDKDPTDEQVDKALQERAADMGADAVILVRYGTVGIGAFSWGTLDGNGRAVVFQ